MEQINDHDFDDFDINPNESASQIFTDVQSETTDNDTSTTLSRESSVWSHFDKKPSYAPQHNGCRACSARYKSTTSVTILRKHLKTHQLEAPPRKRSVVTRENPFNQQEQQEHTKYLIRWLICDLQPFTTVENSYFREFINYFCPRYIVPERHQVKDFIINKFNTRRQKIINYLNQIEGKFSLTTDMWTSINRDAYLGITIHYVDSNWCLCNFLLDIIPFNVRHTGENIAQEIIRVLDEFQISNKIIALTTDNESAMVVCGRELADAFNSELSSMNFSHYRCAAHVLNLGVKQGLQLVSSSIDKVHELMSKIKNSTRLSDRLREFCAIEQMPNYKPILDIEIRWNSTYYMLKRFEQLRPALELLAVNDNNIRNIYPNERDLAAIKVSIYIYVSLYIQNILTIYHIYNTGYTLDSGTFGESH
jgi:hypothetical protein